MNAVLAARETAFTEVLFRPVSPLPYPLWRLRPEPLRPYLSESLPFTSGVDVYEDEESWVREFHDSSKSVQFVSSGVSNSNANKICFS